MPKGCADRRIAFVQTGTFSKRWGPSRFQYCCTGTRQRTRRHMPGTLRFATSTTKQARTGDIHSCGSTAFRTSGARAPVYDAGGGDDPLHLANTRPLSGGCWRGSRGWSRGWSRARSKGRIPLPRNVTMSQAQSHYTDQTDRPTADKGQMPADRGCTASVSRAFQSHCRDTTPGHFVVILPSPSSSSQNQLPGLSGASWRGIFRLPSQPRPRHF